MAITAWSAKVLTSSICLSVNGRTSLRNIDAPIGTPSRSSGIPSPVRKPNLGWLPASRFWIRQQIVQMDYFALKQCSSNDALSSRRMRNALEELFEAGAGIWRQWHNSTRRRFNARYVAIVPRRCSSLIRRAYRGQYSQMVERLITLSTSAVAVCCCRDSRSSLSSRVFSMAMTACAAKFCTSSICLSVNGFISWR